MSEEQHLPTAHRGASITYTDDVAKGKLYAWITMPGGAEINITERLMRVITEDPEDIRRTFVAQVIAKIDHGLDAEHGSWVMGLAEHRR